MGRPPPWLRAPAQLSRVAGVAVVHLAGPDASEPAERIDELRRLVEARCPVASTLAAAGCRLDITWRAATREDAYEQYGEK